MRPNVNFFIYLSLNENRMQLSFLFVHCNYYYAHNTTFYNIHRPSFIFGIYNQNALCYYNLFGLINDEDICILLINFSISDLNKLLCIRTPNLEMECFRLPNEISEAITCNNNNK